MPLRLRRPPYEPHVAPRANSGPYRPTCCSEPTSRIDTQALEQQGQHQSLIFRGFGACCGVMICESLKHDLSTGLS